MQIRIQTLQCENARCWVECRARFSAICLLTLSFCLFCRAVCHAHQYLLNKEQHHTLLATAATHEQIMSMEEFHGKFIKTRQRTWAIQWAYNEILCCNYRTRHEQKISHWINFSDLMNKHHVPPPPPLTPKVASWTQVGQVWYLLPHF